MNSLYNQLMPDPRDVYGGGVIVARRRRRGGIFLFFFFLRKMRNISTLVEKYHLKKLIHVTRIYNHVNWNIIIHIKQYISNLSWQRLVFQNAFKDFWTFFHMKSRVALRNSNWQVFTISCFQGLAMKCFTHWF